MKHYRFINTLRHTLWVWFFGVTTVASLLAYSPQPFRQRTTIYSIVATVGSPLFLKEINPNPVILEGVVQWITIANHYPAVFSLVASAHTVFPKSANALNSFQVNPFYVSPSIHAP